jgi:ketol-acid reductoisomerase
MIGWGVRNIYLKGGGAPAYIAVHQDSSRTALKTVLALAKAIGSTRSCVIETGFAEETEIDLFLEQAVWAIITRAMILSFETLVEVGYPPEIVALELYGSGEASEVMKAMADIGFFKQMSLHSRTSQYGTLSRGPWILNNDVKDAMKTVLDEIKTGLFAREWGVEQMLGTPVYRKLKENALKHPMNDAEDTMKKILKK